MWSGAFQAAASEDTGPEAGSMWPAAGGVQSQHAAPQMWWKCAEMETTGVAGGKVGSERRGVVHRGNVCPLSWPGLERLLAE